MSDDVAAQLEELRRSYLGSLPTKVAALTSAVGRRAVDDTRHLAHRLRGTAASYFATEVSQTAGRIEDACDRDPVDWARIEGLLAQLASDAKLAEERGGA